MPGQGGKAPSARVQAESGQVLICIGDEALFPARLKRADVTRVLRASPLAASRSRSPCCRPILPPNPPKHATQKFCRLSYAARSRWQQNAVFAGQESHGSAVVADLQPILRSPFAHAILEISIFCSDHPSRKKPKQSEPVFIARLPTRAYGKSISTRTPGSVDLGDCAPRDGKGRREERDRR